MTKDREFYNNFFIMLVMLVLQNIVSLSVNLADNIMLGAYSEAALAGVASVNQIQFLYQQILLGIGDGLVILSSQYWGKKQTQPIKHTGAAAMWFAIIIMAVLFLLASIMPGKLVGLFTTDTAIIGEGTAYLSIIRFSYLFFCLTTILLSLLRSVETVKIAFYLSVSTLLINCSLNWIFIYGHFGMPELGAKGAAIGTLTARIVEFLWIVLYLWKREKKLYISISDFFKIDPALLKDYLRICTPMILVQSLWGLNTAVQTAILGHMTANAIAANSAASNLYMIVKAGAVGAASVASVIIGKTIGTGEYGKVKEYAKTLQVLFLGIGILSGIVLFFSIDPVLSLYKLAPQTKELAHAFLLVLCVAMVGMAYQMPVNVGIIRGGGDTKYVVKLDLISIWGIVIPLSCIMAFVVKASPIIVICCLNADQIFKCIPAFLKVNYGHWAKKLTREEGTESLTKL